MKKIILTTILIIIVSFSYTEWILDEGFENGYIPNDWTIYDLDGDGNAWHAYHNPEYANSGSWSAIVENYLPNENEDWLITPQLYISEGDSLFFSTRSWISSEELKVFVSNTTNSVDDFTDEILHIENIQTEYQHFYYNLSAYAGSSIYIGFKWQCNLYAILLDDIKVGQTPVSFTPPPQNLQAIAGNNLIYLYWEQPYQATPLGYNIYRNHEIINDTIITETYYTDYDVINYNLYTYYVTALYEDGESENSNQIEIMPEEILLESPHNLSAESINETFFLIWEAPTSNGLLGYLIYRNNQQINTDLVENTEYQDYNIEFNHNYEYYVTAVYVNGESEPSNSVSILIPDTNTVQIGSGTQTNSTNGAVPINIFYKSLRGQMVYTASEINSAGFETEGILTSMGFYVHNAPHYQLPDFVVRIKHTTAENAEFHDDGPFEEVYFSENYAPVEDSWDMLTFDTPFLWNGYDNILIDTAFNLTENWNPSGQIRIIDSVNGYRYSRSDSNNQTNTPTNSIANYKPQIKLSFSTNFPPYNLTASGGDGFVELNWDFNENFLPTGYNIYRNSVQINQNIITETNYTDTNVENDNSYMYYVTALYQELESEPSNSVFVTPQEDPELLPPLNLTATIKNKNNVLLTWDPPDYQNTVSKQKKRGYKNNITGYNIYRNEELVDQTDFSITSYFDEDLQLGVYVYYVTSTYEDQESNPSEEVIVKIIETNIDSPVDYQMSNNLIGNYPNPFNPYTFFYFTLEKSEEAKIEIFNVKGQIIRTLSVYPQNNGFNRVRWNGRNNIGTQVNSGIYLYRLKTNNFVSNPRKMILVK